MLRHLDLQSTCGYVAAVEGTVVRNYQLPLARGRQKHPQEHYQPVTDGKWREFEEHFDEHEVELGNCGRPYNTPSVREHACIRCQMLRVDPALRGPE